MKKINVVFTIALAVVMIFILPGKSKGQEDENKGHKHHCDQSEINLSGVRIQNLGDDSVVIYIKKKDRNFQYGGTNWGTFPFYCKKGKYNGHWAGVDFGWNGYVNKDFNMDFGPGNDYLNLNTARSLMINLNPLELNVNIAKNKFGFTSGLGFSLNNYYFSDSYTLIGDSSTLVAFNTIDDKGHSVGMKVNKLFVSYITIPLLFEYQTNARHRLNSFHIAVGVIGGLRLQTYQKQRLYQWQDTYFLADDNGKKIASFYADSPVIRNHDPYHLNPFKLDATVRVGWSFLNLFATYSLTPMYQKNKGPVLYPWTVGITLVGW
ncbi:MAG: outer membrane beta-barrel protein [Bacteroidales bacterium]|nr:outer membrane beta-barrel protein [Bacteroidales bacterium]